VSTKLVLQVISTVLIPNIIFLLNTCISYYCYIVYVYLACNSKSLYILCAYTTPVKDRYEKEMAKRSESHLLRVSL